MSPLSDIEIIASLYEHSKFLFGFCLAMFIMFIVVKYVPTKKQLDSRFARLEDKVEDVEIGLKNKIESVESDLQDDMKSVKMNLERVLNEFKDSVDRFSASVDRLSKSIDVKFEEVNRKINKNEKDIIRLQEKAD